MQFRDYSSLGERLWVQKLENGLWVYVLPKPEYTKACAYLAVNYGGADRNFILDGKNVQTPAGVAHFLEHKMFDMPDYHALQRLTEQGAKANAFTSGSMTAYHFECGGRFEKKLQTLIELVTVPYFTEESVKKEQGIIGQEIRMTEGNPGSVIYYQLLKLLFQENPLRDSVAGTVESIAEITPEILYGCHRAFYRPSNMVLCVVGNVEPEDICRMARQATSPELLPVPERLYGTEPKLPAEVHSQSSMAVGTPMFRMGARLEGELKGEPLLKKMLTGQLAMELLMGKGSALYTELYQEGLINSTFAFGTDALADTGYLLFGGESKAPNRVGACIMEGAEAMVCRGIDEDRLRLRKKAMIGQKLREMNSFDNICYNILYGHFRGFDAMGEMKTLSQITAEDVRRFLQENFRLERMAVANIQPL